MARASKKQSSKRALDPRARKGARRAIAAAKPSKKSKKTTVKAKAKPAPRKAAPKKAAAAKKAPPRKGAPKKVAAKPRPKAGAKVVAKKQPPKKAAARKPAPKPAPKPKVQAKAPAKVQPQVKAKPQTKAPAAKAVAPAKAAAPQQAKPQPAAKAEPPPPVVKAPPKPVAKAPPPEPPKPKKPRKPEITPREIEKIKVALEEQRGVFAREYTEIEEGAFNVSQSEMSGEVSFDEEYADAGSFTFEREKELSIGQNIRDLLDKVDHALQLISRGQYGLCENCGDPINKARLLALPYSTLCIKCKQQEERTR